VKLKIMKWNDRGLCCVISVALLGILLYAASTGTSSIPEGDKVKVAGLILSRNGGTVRIKDKKSGQFVVINFTDNTKMERARHSS
jgi:hypothetical protein